MHRWTLPELNRWATANGWTIERDGRRYNYWRIDERGCGPVDGMECEATTLDEAYADMASENAAIAFESRLDRVA